MKTVISLLLQSAPLLAQLAPLEPAENKMYLGAWYDRLNGDTPAKINSRLNYKPMSFFQSDMNITDTLQSGAIDQFIQHIEETQTNAFVYLTLYPFEGFDKVTDRAVDEFVDKVKGIVSKGHKIMIRYASEMNGDWFAYGQKPTQFIRYYRDMVTKVRAAVGRDNVAFLFAPNSGNGYPFGQGPFAAKVGTAGFDSLLDTNGNGQFDRMDDPYTPYYPGDEYVDWVGFSIYHYGNIWAEPNGWTTNDIAVPGKAESILLGKNGWGEYNFYEMFSGSGAGGNPTSKSQGGKPFFITETGSTTFLAINDRASGTWIRAENTSPEFRAQAKQTWWRQIINSTFLELHPKVKGIAFFEFVKYEETSWRDFTMLGKGTNISSVFGNDAGDMDGLVLDALKSDLRGDLGNLIKWGDPKGPEIGSNNPVTGSKSISHKLVPAYWILFSMFFIF
jgi:hypothetical protein